jgi:uncharacterized iron-regulated protein
MTMQKIFLLTLSLCCSIFLFAQKFTAYRSGSTEPVSLADMAAALSTANIVFVGEEHNDSMAHVLQHELFKALHQLKGNQLALSLEMFETDCQTPLNDYLQGFITEAQMIKDARAWGNYKDYRPLVEYAKEQSLAVIAANAPRRYVNLVARRGMKSLDSLSKEAKQWLPKLPYDTLDGAYAKKFWDLMAGHGRPSIYHSQSLWDAAMSNSMHQYQKKHKKELIYHLCGRFHSDDKLGTAEQLQRRNKKLVIKNVTCIPKEQANSMSKEALAAIADFVVITEKE